MNNTNDQDLERELASLAPGIGSELRDRLLYESGITVGRRESRRRAILTVCSSSAITALACVGLWWSLPHVSDMGSSNMAKSTSSKSQQATPRPMSETSREDGTKLRGYQNHSIARDQDERSLILKSGVLTLAHSTRALDSQGWMSAETNDDARNANAIDGTGSAEVLRPSSRIVW